MKTIKKNILYLFRLGVAIISFITAGLMPVKAASIVSRIVTDSLAKKVDAIFSEFNKSSSPGCALAILKDGKIIYKKGYGMATLEYNIPISSSSIFHVASISKQFTAATILRLVQERKVSLDDDIRKYIPEVPDFGYIITFQHLLHHTSGLRDQYDLQKLAGWRSDDVITEDDILDMLKRQKKLNFVPGDEFSYSNTGYTLLGIAVKKITGISLRDYADSVFFKPLGMHHTHFHNDHAEVTPNRTSAYLKQANKWKIFIPVLDNYGATSLFTTVEDLAKWDENFYSSKVGNAAFKQAMEVTPNRTSAYLKQAGKWKIFIPVLDNYGATSLFTTVEDLAKWDENFYSGKVGNAAFRQAMELTGTLNNNTSLFYASGLVVEKYKGYKTIGHPGSDAGYRSNYLRFPEQHFSIILLGNAANMNTTALTHKVADIFLKNITDNKLPIAVKIDSNTVKKRAGTYIDFNSKSIMVLHYKNQKLITGSDSLTAVNKNTFVNTSNGSTYTFADGLTRTGLKLHTTGYKDVIYEKVPEATWQPSHLEEYTGEFYSLELDTHYKFSAKNGALFVKVPRNKEIQCRPLAEDIFTGSLVVQYYRNSKKEVEGFLLTLGRTRNIDFQKVE